MEVAIAQALHGYDDGHRLLARGGDIREDELALLDRLTDLTGYIPTGFDFDHYIGGYPCGRYYALTRTWHDRNGARRGTVLTHTLLFPTGAAIAAPLEELVALFRRPSEPIDRAPYRAVFSVRWPDERPLTPRLGDADVAALAMVVSLQDRPILWLGESHAEIRVAKIWAAIPPPLRTKFAFCTMALGVPRHPTVTFDLLFAPNEARTAFMGHVPSAAWLEDPAAALDSRRHAVPEQPWFKSFQLSPVDWLDDVTNWCLSHEVMPNALRDLASVDRVRELASLAGTRVTAARGRLDLALRLWPDMTIQNSLARRLLDDLLDTQPTASGLPRPMWEFTELLRRPQFRARVEQDVSYGTRAARILHGEVVRRLGEHGDHAWETLGALLGAVPNGRLGEAANEAVKSATSSLLANGDERLLMRALPTLPSELAEDLAVDAIQKLPAERRVAFVADVRMAMGEGRDLASLWKRIRESALASTDHAVVYEVLRSESDGVTALSSTVSWASRVGLPAHSLELTLKRGAPTDRLTWALNCADSAFRTIAVRIGVDAARELSLPVTDLFDRAHGAVNGQMVFVEVLYAMDVSARNEMLQRNVDFARSILSVALASADASEDKLETLSNAAVAALLDSGMSAVIHEVVSGAPVSALRTRLMIRVVRQLLASDHESRAAGSRVVPWLDMPDVRVLVGHSTADELWQALPSAVSPGDALARAAGAARATLSNQPDSAEWIVPLLTYPLRRARARDLAAAAADVAVLIAAIRDDARAQELAADCMVAVRRNVPRNGHILVEVAFPRVYPDLMYRDRNPFWRTNWPKSGWDRQQDWRHWLLDTWLTERWPPEALLRTVNGDLKLLRHLAVRASGRTGGRDFVERLQQILIHQPQARAAFRGDPIAVVSRPPGFFEAD